MGTPRRFGWLVLLLSTLFALLVPPSMAQAQANVFRFEFQEPLTGSTALPECLPPDLGGHPDRHRDDRRAGDRNRADLPGPRHDHAGVPGRLPGRERDVVGTAVEHFSFIVNGPQTISTTTIPEPRTIYSADGQPIGQVFLHGVFHVTFRDANGNGEPDLVRLPRTSTGSSSPAASTNPGWPGGAVERPSCHATGQRGLHGMVVTAPAPSWSGG